MRPSPWKVSPDGTLRILVDAAAPDFFGRLSYKMAARKAYFKAISQEQIDADQASALLSLGSRVSAVESGKADASAVAAKADVSYVDSAVGEVATALDSKLSISQAAATYATAISVLQKADIAYVEGQINNLATSKADASDVLALQQQVSPLSASVIGLQSQVANKQDATAAQQRVSAENAFIGALKEALFLESAPGSGVEYDYSALGL